MPAKVVIRNLCKNYGSIAALRGLNLEIAAGEIVGLLGTNGAGKTTAIECIVGLRTPDDGQVLIDGIDIRDESAEARQRIGVVLQNTALPDQITPIEALALFGSLYRQRTEPAVLLERFGLTAQTRSRFNSLSGGQRQRLALALAFVNKPSLIILDEPTAGLDPQARLELHDAILRLKAEGHTVLLTTHYLEEAERLCDRVVIVDRGLVITTGSPGELIARAKNHQTITVLTDRPVNADRLAQLPGVRKLVAEGLKVELSTTEGTATIQALLPLLALEQVALVDLHLRQTTLEDAFLGLIRTDRENSSEGSS
jgi:ABC-2 type transport system ATP-binding protein